MCRILLDSGYFSDPIVTKVISDEIPEGNAISIQLRSDSIDAVNQWKTESGTLFQKRDFIIVLS